MGDRHMSDHTFAKKRFFACEGAVNKLINDHKGAGREGFFQRAHGRQRDHIRDAQTLERIDIGTVVHFGGRNLVAATVARQKGHRLAE